MSSRVVIARSFAMAKTIDRSSRILQSASLTLCLGAALSLLWFGSAAAETTAKSIDTACSVPEGQSAEAIVGRVEKRINGDWNLATKTLRQTIARQQRLGQDSAAAEDYLKTLSCLQGEVESGQHNAYLEANGGKARLAGSSQSLVSQSAPSQPYVAPVPSAGEQAPATAAPADLSSVSAASQSILQASPQQPSTVAPAPQANAVAPTQAAPSTQSQETAAAPLSQQPTIVRQEPQIRDGLILPGTPESFALNNGGQTAARSTVPAIKPVDGGAPILQSGSLAPGTTYNSNPTRQARLVVPPQAPKWRGTSLQQLASRAAPAPAPVQANPAPAPDPQITTAPISAPSAAETAASQAEQSPAPAVQTAAVEAGGDPRYVNKACLYFTRPELEVIRSRVYTNRHPIGARVCHQGNMYLCDGGLWSSQGSCSAHADAASLDSSVLEAKPRR